MRHVVTFLTLVFFYSSSYSQFSFDSTNVGSGAILNDIASVRTGLRIVVGDSGVSSRTTDGGFTWTRISTGTTTQLTGVAFADDQIGCACGSRTLKYTTDGGLTWSSASEQVPGSHVAIAFGSRSNGATVGLSGMLYHTSDGGKSWFSITSPTGNTLYGIAFTDSNRAVAVGKAGTIVGSSNGGATWTLLQPQNATLLHEVVAASPTVLLTCGSNGSAGVMYRSTDAGSTWDSVNIRSPKDLLSITFAGPDTGFARSSGGTLYRTVDQGITWDSVAKIPYWGNPFGISCRSSHELLIPGQGGYVYTVSFGPFASVGPALSPVEFSLEQNFPNPFNPTTTIRYALPHRSAVRLSVFNSLGQLITVLQNGEQDAGDHEATFNGSGLASGVYFYQISSGEFERTRKLLLVK